MNGSTNAAVAADASAEGTRAGPAIPGESGAFWTMVLAFVALVAYWAIWFGVNRDWLATAHTPEYYVFENAFPLADAWMALASLSGAIALKRRTPSCLFWMLVGGGASIYLGCMDVLFDLENGIYLAPTGDWVGVGIEVAINLATLGAGAWILYFAWKNRRALLNGSR